MPKRVQFPCEIEEMKPARRRNRDLELLPRPVVLEILLRFRKLGCSLNNRHQPIAICMRTARDAVVRSLGQTAALGRISEQRARPLGGFGRRTKIENSLAIEAEDIAV